MKKVVHLNQYYVNNLAKCTHLFIIINNIKARKIFDRLVNFWRIQNILKIMNRYYKVNLYLFSIFSFLKKNSETTQWHCHRIEMVLCRKVLPTRFRIVYRFLYKTECGVFLFKNTKVYCIINIFIIKFRDNA